MKILDPQAIGRPMARTEGPDKITGRALYAYEYDVDDVTYAWIVPASIVRGRVRDLDDSAAREHEGVIDVIWHRTAEKLGVGDDAELSVLQDDQVHYHGQAVALVVADTAEAAREAAALVRVVYDVEPHHSALRADDPALYAPDQLNAGFTTDTEDGDVDAAFASAAHAVDRVYSTPALHNSPMEPHATIARWDDGRLTVWDSNQAPSGVAASLATAFGLESDDVHVVTQHVGGGFGSKGSARPNVVLAALAARATNRAVKLAVTRQMMFSLVGYRTPTIQHVRLAADVDGRLLAIEHATVEQSSTIVEFAEQTGESTRHMYAAPARRVTHRLARLDMPSPRWMRAPGEAPGMFAVESAIDELAVVAGVDPIELRIRNEPDVDPASGDLFSSRQFVGCLREGAQRFGWTGRTSGLRNGTLVGHGVAGATYPVNVMPSSARVSVDDDGRYSVEIAAADIGQGARTVLRQIAADALGVDVDVVTVHLGDSTLPTASVAGGSAGTSSWGWAITDAARDLRGRLGRTDGVPAGGLSVEFDTTELLAERVTRPRHAFGAQFVEVHVDPVTAEVRVERALGVFAVGRIMNSRLARSQLLGGMTMGLSMGLMEGGVLDERFGQWMNHDLAEYHVATNADIRSIEAHWLDEDDDDLNPMGGKGIGEIGIVGIAAAVTNAVFDATGVRIRDLPVRVDKLWDDPAWAAR